MQSGSSEMISKETLINWLYEHGQLTADMEFDIHDCFEAAFDAAQTLLPDIPDIGFLSKEKRVNSFLSICKELDKRMDAGSLDPCEALVALSILRAQSKKFQKAIRAFEAHAPTLPEMKVKHLPAAAKEYLENCNKLTVPLVAG